MFNLGGGEILVILLLALIVLGPQRLPDAARKLGSALGEVRRMANGFQTEIKAAFDEVDVSSGSTTPAPTTTTSRERPVTGPAPEPDGAGTVAAGAEPTPPPGPEAPGRDDAVA
jgi:sec-independent protein translocase protein TatB